MAYVIKYDDEYLFDPYVGEDTVTDATITATINASSYFDFTITRDHRLYNTVKERSGIVSVYFDSTLLFMGEITSIEEDFYGSKTISCVDPRDQLSNVILRPYSTVEGEQANLAPSSVDGYFQWLIDQYNDGMINAKFKLDVGVNQGAYLDKNNYIYRENDQFPTVASELEDKILDSLGGYLTLTYPNGSPTLNLYSDVHEANTQIIDFGVNLLDFSKETATSDQYTAIRPVGGTPERDSDESDAEEPKPVTLEPLGDGVTSVDSDYIKRGDVVYCLSAVNRYGYKEYNWSEGDTLDPQELLEKAVAELKKNVEPKLTIEVSAVDMALFAEGYDHLECGQVARVRSKPHGIDEYLMVSSVDIDLQDPSQTKYTLGQAFDSLTGEQSSYVKSLNSGINSSLDSVAALDQTVKDQASQIGSVEQIANDAKDTATNAQNTANSAQQAAQDAQNSASSALDKAEAAEGAVSEIQGMIDEINSGAEQAKQDAAQAKADAQQAAAKADAASEAAQAAADKADAFEGQITDITTTVNGVVTDVEELTTSVSGAVSIANEALSTATTASQDLEGFKTTVSQTYQLKGDYATNSALDDAMAQEVLNRNSAIEQSAKSITSTVSQTYATKTDLAVTDGKATQAQSSASQAQNSASAAQSTANQANQTANGVADDLTDYMETVATTYASKSELEQTSESITATVEANYTEVKQLANTAQSTADSALSKANEASGELADFTESVTSDLSDLQDQIDGNIATWFYAGTPTLTNEPAVNWSTTEEKNQHLGDLYYDTNNGYAWRFMVQNGSYSWGRITDSDVTKALADAANAQDTADSKRRVFVSQPTPPYDVGDLWVQGENGDILRCATARASGSHNASDWVLASKYTDDSALEIFEGQVADIYSTKAELETATDAITATVEENFEKSVLVKEADGGIIDCGDTAGMPLAGLIVYGQTRQNLWVNPSGTSTGVTVTSNSNGSVTVSGTATSTFRLDSEPSYILKPSTVYTVSVDNVLADTYVGGNKEGACFYVSFLNANDGYIKDYTFGYGSYKKVTFTAPESFSHVRFRINVSSGTTVSGTYRVMLNEGSTAEPWCPPRMSSVNSVEVVQGGRNLWKNASMSLNGIKTTANDDGTVTVSGTSTAYTGGAISFANDAKRLRPGETYTLSLDKSLPANVIFYVAEVVNGVWTTRHDVASTTPTTFTVKENTQNCSIGFVVMGVGITVSGTYKVMLNVGDKAEEWTAPIEVVPTNIPLLGNRLRSLPDGTRDELHIDFDGNVTLTKRVEIYNIDSNDLVDNNNNDTYYFSHTSPIFKDLELSEYYPLCDVLKVDQEVNASMLDRSIKLSTNGVAITRFIGSDMDGVKTFFNAGGQILGPIEEEQTLPLGKVDLPALNASGATVWTVALDQAGNTYTLDPDIHATWYAENASALKNFASKAELKVESDQIKATVEETYSTKEEVSAVEGKADAAQSALDSYKSTVSTTYATKSEVTQTADAIRSEVSEDYVTKDAANSTYATKTSVSTVEQTVDSLTSTVQSNYTTLNDKFNNYYNKTQVDQKEDAIQLNAQRIAGINYNQAKMLYPDPCFEKGLNGVVVYNNSANGNVTITRQSGNSSDPFTFSNYRLMIQNKGSANPACGGFYFGNNSRANAVFLYRIWALIPTGRNIHWRANSYGTGGNATWLTSTAGTGAFEEYVCVATCGSTGTFDSIGFFYIDGAVGSSSSPVTWYVAYATCFDVTNKSDYSTLRVDVDGIEGRVSDAEGNISTLTQTASGLEVRLGDAENDIGTATNTANDAKTTATNAQTTANTANTNANTANMNASTALSIANTAKTTADAASDDAATALSTANTANNTANTANSTANAAKTAAANAQTAATNAAKTATNFLKFDSAGLCVGNMTGTLGFNALITSNAYKLRAGTTEIASFSASQIDLGKNSTLSSISMCGGMGHLVYDSAYGGRIYLGAAGSGNNISVTAGGSGVMLQGNSSGYAQYSGNSFSLIGTESLPPALRKLIYDNSFIEADTLEVLGFIRLWYQSGGTTSRNIKCSDTLTNYRMLLMMFQTNDGTTSSSVFMYPWNNAKWNVSAVDANPSNVCIKTDLFTISGANLVGVSGENRESAVHDNNTCGGTANFTCIKPFAVYGFK